MILHMVLFKWGRTLTTVDEKNLQGAFEGLRNIPEARHLVHGPDLGIRPRTCDYAMTARFEDADALARYIEHPAHVAVVAALGAVDADMTIAQIDGPR
jgi:hypothetical protein